MGKTIRFNENGLIAIKGKLNEIMVGTDGVSHNDVYGNVKLYHGTTIDALLMIMESGVMSAKRGKQHGETYGVNWFSLKNGDNFNKGVLFSIEVPGDVFNERFRMMNSSEAVSKDDDLDITGFNLTIEKICGLSRGAIKNAYDRYVSNGDRYPLESIGYLFDHFIEKVQDDDVLFPSILYHNWDKYYPMIMKNILGNNINESVAKEFAPVTSIGMEKGGGPGLYAHKKEVDEEIDFDDNGMSINDDKILGKYNLKDLILSKTGNYVTLNKIVANELGKGCGSKFMEELARIADKNGWILVLTPDTAFGGSSVSRLKNFYKRFGFVPNKGKNTDFNTRESMIRKPLNENKYDDLFDIRNTNKKISDCEEAISYFKNVSDEIREKKEHISSKYGCKSMFFIASINQGVIQANQNDVNEFHRLSDERREIEEKIKTLKDLIKEIEKEEKREKEAQKYRLEQEENDRIFSLVIDEYGTTNRIENAEYILPDGTMLYSGGDHRGIASIYATNNISIFDDKYRYNYVVDFLNRGAIRCRMFDGDGILDMTREPTGKQYQVINTFARYASNINIDFTSNEGETLNSVSYSNATPQRITSDIYKYYNEGIIPQENSRFESKKSKSIVISENKLDVIKENIESEVESSEVDLSSFKKRDTLPPKIWKDEETLNSKVRLKLLDIADDFWKFVNLTWVEPKGIIITGSICNFNWSKFSDIDLHLVVDFNEIDSKTEFVKQYLDSKKNEWNAEHEGLKIMGFPVELYTQDVSDNVEAGGIYDLEENAWIRKPNPHTIKSIGLEKFDIKRKAAEIMTIIDEMYKTLSSTDDGYEVSKIGEDASYLWEKVKSLRKKSLTKRGENGAGNIVYKVLRRTGYLDKLFKLFSATYDKSNSITEGVQYDRLRNDQVFRYRVIADMVKDGYVFHGTGEDGNGVEWDAVDPSKIKGGSRGTYGYGIYFSDHAYKCEKYAGYSGGHFIIANIKGFNLINLRDKIDKENNIFVDKQVEYHRLCDALDNARNNREYDMILAKIDEYKETVDKELLYEITRIIDKSDGDITYGYLNENIPLLWYMEGDSRKRVSNLYLSLGIDGFAVDTEFVIFNFDKLNNAIVKNKEELILQYVQKAGLSESAKQYLKVLKEEFAMDGSSEGNPYEKRWKAERDALKNFVANYGKLMQSKEDNKMGRLYKVYYDETMSNLIGYNYCICVQWDELTMKPKSTVYIRALDKFTPFIRRNLQYDDRGLDNQRGTYDDNRFVRESVDELNLYHSSYSSFDKFNHRKYLSSGAGSQTFGWGTYLTDSYPIAKDYAEKFILLKFNEFIVKAEPEKYIENNGSYDEELIKEAAKTYKQIVRFNISFNPDKRWSKNSFNSSLKTDENATENYDSALKEYEQAIQMAKSWAENVLKTEFNLEEFKANYSKNSILKFSKQEYINNVNRQNAIYQLVKEMINNIWDDADKHVRKESYIYEVETPDDNGLNYIDLNNEVPNEIIESITSTLSKISRRYGGEWKTMSKWREFLSYCNNAPKGEDIHDELGKLVGVETSIGNYDKAISLFLLQCGIDGFKYKAGTIYGLPDGADENSTNYVIFDANKVRIVSKNLFTDTF
jgi:hypothetical protein